jgi:hypothetical protein
VSLIPVLFAGAGLVSLTDHFELNEITSALRRKDRENQEKKEIGKES